MKTICRAIATLLILTLLPFAFSAQAEKSNGIVRVLLTRPALTDRVDLALDGSYTLNEMAFQRGSHLIVSVSGASLYVYYEGMSLNAGKEVTLVRHAVTGGAENGIRINGAYELHPGDLHLTIQNGRLQAVLYAPMEEYLLGVVPYEMSDSFPLEALKAQAIAARTYALKRAGANPLYDVVDNTNDQVYCGVKKENDVAAKAIQETAGLCGFYQGALADCFYSASNGGQTELASHVWGRSDYGYLTMVDDPYDLENPESTVKSFSFPKTVSQNSVFGNLTDPILGSLSETLDAMGYDGDTEHIRIVGIENAEVAIPLYSDSPSRIMTLLRLSLRVQARRLLSDDGEEEISIFSVPTGTTMPNTQQEERWSDMALLPRAIPVALDLFPTVESALGLSIQGGSNEIMSIRETETAFILESRRYGHGVGLSQRGAQQMAGIYHWTYDQILGFYYPGMKIEKVQYTFVQPTPMAQQFLTTPGPAATPTPRPTLMPVSATPGPGEYIVTVSNIGVNSYLNLRAEPNTQATVLRQLYYGQQLLVTKEMDAWLQVKTDDAVGYVMAEFVKKAE